jgi:4-amino-4-deoxy-L-arabinose transferase-like glycosyltransferase
VAAVRSSTLRRAAGPWTALARRPWLAALAFLALYVLVTLLAPGSLVDRSDETVYLAYAERVADGGYALRDTTHVNFLWYGPLLPMLVAPLVAIDAPIELIRMVSPVALALALVVFHRILRLFVSSGWALAGMVALGLYFPLWRLLPRLFTEPLAILLLLCGVLCSVRYLRGGGAWWLPGAGVALGGLLLTRLEFGYVFLASLVVCLAWWALRRDLVPRRSVAVFAVALVPALPWLAYTHDLTGRFPYWGNSGGLSLYWMASPFSQDLGDPHPEQAVFSDPRLAEHRPFFRKLGRLDPVAADDELRHEARQNIEDNPGRYGRNLAANFGRMFFRVPFSFEQSLPKIVLFGVPGSLLLAGLITGLWLRLRRGLRDAELVPAALIGLFGFGVHLVVAAYPRSIAVLAPLFILAATLGLAAAHQSRGDTPA